MSFFWTSTVQKNAQKKRQERQSRIDELTAYQVPLTRADKKLLSMSTQDAVIGVRDGSIDPLNLLKAYGKQTLSAQQELNNVTEIMFKDAEKSAKEVKNKIAKNKDELPLAGFPVSIKDTADIKGYDSTIGYSFRCFKPKNQDSPLIRLLKDAGAYPFVKTNVPYTMLSFECYNDIWGVTENPYLKGYTPGGSTGGEAANLAFGGSRIGVGTDVAGSVRVPAHFSGIYAIKCSVGRFPKSGNTTSMAGQEGIPAVYSPMARTLADLTYFLKSVIDMKPWNYDYSCLPIPWREQQLPAKLKIGVMYDDGVVKPTPACARALELTVDALKKQGHVISTFNPPSPLKALRIASQLLCSDSCKIALRGQASGEHNDAGVGRMVFAQRLPRFVKRIYAWFLEHVMGDSVWAYMVRDWNEKNIVERWDLVAEREGYKSKFFEAWKSADIDILLTVPNATPALPHKGLYESISSCGYTFLFNLLDYSAGVLPVTRVDKEMDALNVKQLGKLNRIAKGAYANYDAVKQHGLPVGVQVVGRQLEEEKVLAAMNTIENALHDVGIRYTQRNEY